MISKISLVQAVLLIILFISVNTAFLGISAVNIIIFFLFILALFVYFYEFHSRSQKETEIMKLKNSNVKDHLTRLYNRRYLDKLLAKIHEESVKRNIPFSVIMLDIDHFKKINDDYGHDKGDEVLKAFADILARTVRTEDYAARFGGEEFMVLLINSVLTDAVMVAFRIKTAIAKEKIKDVGYITVSMGVIEAGEKLDENVEDIVKHVDELLYAAKESGRNRIIARGKERMVEITDSLTGVLNEI